MQPRHSAARGQFREENFRGQICVIFEVRFWSPLARLGYPEAVVALRTKNYKLVRTVLVAATHYIWIWVIDWPFIAQYLASLSPITSSLCHRLRCKRHISHAVFFVTTNGPNEIRRLAETKLGELCVWARDQLRWAICHQRRTLGRAEARQVAGWYGLNSWQTTVETCCRLSKRCGRTGRMDLW